MDKNPNISEQAHAAKDSPTLDSRDLIEGNVNAHHHEAGGAPGREEDYYPSHEALCDLVSLISEHDALTGGGPGWTERWKKAVLAAEEIVRVEP